MPEGPTNDRKPHQSHQYARRPTIGPRPPITYKCPKATQVVSSCNKSYHYTIRPNARRSHTSQNKTPKAKQFTSLYLAIQKPEGQTLQIPKDHTIHKTNAHCGVIIVALLSPNYSPVVAYYCGPVGPIMA